MEQPLKHQIKHFKIDLIVWKLDTEKGEQKLDETLK